MLKHADIPAVSLEDLDLPDFYIADILDDVNSNELEKKAIDALRECLPLKDLKSQPLKASRKLARTCCRILSFQTNMRKYVRLRAGLDYKPPTYKHIGFDLLYSEKVEPINEAKVKAFAKSFSSYELRKVDAKNIKLLIGHCKDFDETDNLFVVLRKLVAVDGKGDEMCYVTVFWKCD